MRTSLFLLLTFFASSALNAQTAQESFRKAYSDFLNANSVFLNGGFQGSGKKKGASLTAHGTIGLEKQGLTILRYHSLAESEIPILDKISYEQTIFDGKKVWAFNSLTGIFVDHGSWEPDGKKYVGYSSILYGNLLTTLEEFRKLEDQIEILRNGDRYTLTLPGTADRGKVVMHFTDASSSPNTIVRYDHIGNSEDFVSLTFSTLRYNSVFPPNFFNVHDRKSGQPVNPDSVFLQAKKRQDERAPDLLAKGTRAPDWELLNSDGIKRKLSDFKGKVVVLDFWATWCAPCVQAQPFLQKLHETKMKDVVVLGMDYNDRQGIPLNEYKKKKKITYEMILNAETIGEDYRVRVLPTVYVIDRAGYIIHSGFGYSEKESIELSNVIDKLSN